MKECPWCGRQNLNVYAYCQGCGRGFDGPDADEKPRKSVMRGLGRWLRGGRVSD